MSLSSPSFPRLLLFSFCFLVLYSIADIFFDSSFTQANKNAVSQMQTHSSSSASKFFDLVGVLGQGFFYFIVLFLQFYFVSDKLEILIFLCFHCFNGYLNALLKISYGSERPYMQFEDIQALSCEISLGRPSGHAQSSILFYIFLCRFIVSRVKIYNSMDKIFFYGFTILLIFLIGFSRVFLGVHSFEQVLLGWNYGQFVLILWFCSQKRLLETFRKRQLSIISQQNLSLSKVSNLQAFKRRLTAEITLLVLAITITTIITVIVFELRRNLTEFPSSDLQRILSKCSENLTTAQLFAGTLYNTTYIFVVFGVFLGLIVTRGSFNPEEFWLSFRNTNVCKHCLRVFILAVIILALLGVPFGLKNNTNSNVYVILLLKNYLPYFLFGAVFIYLPPRLYQYCQVELAGDFLKREQTIQRKIVVEMQEMGKLELS